MSTSRGTYIYPPTFRCLVTDIFAYCARGTKLEYNLDRGYHIREAGSTAVQRLPSPSQTELPTSKLRSAGLEVDDFAPRISFSLTHTTPA